MSRRALLLTMFTVLILGSLIWFWMVKCEGEQPTLSLDREVMYLGKQNHLTLIARDRKSGIKKVVVNLSQNGKELLLAEKSFQLENWFCWPKVTEQKIELDIEPVKLGIKNGAATLICNVWDHSLRGWFHGNRVVLQKNLTVDTVPPIISIVSNTKYLEQGGVGLACFSVSEKPAKGGVRVGDQLYAASPLDASRNLYQAYFPIGIGYTNEKIQAWAEDLAGNNNASDFFYRVKMKKFRKDKLELSDSFLKEVADRFSQSYPDLGPDPIKAFLKINTEIRDQSTRKITEICSTSSPEKLWNGVFVPLPNGEARALYADGRTYVYGGKEISSSMHWGVDLASLANSPIPAGNTGVVVWADYLGIYGNAVIIDHGLGLFSLYGHMSSLAVKKGDQVNKGQILGSTGSTGLAGGDHLHFGMYLWGIPVNPAEWWDDAWVQKKIMEPLDATKLTVPSLSPVTDAVPTGATMNQKQINQSEPVNRR
jgi:murein DD-endopeptidase MepM/ murein hydrolase activator NlpD